MDLKGIFLTLSIIQGLFGQIIGIISILKGSFKPQRMTRFLYFLMNFLFVGTLIAQGSWDALGLAGAQFIGNAIIFFLSFKHGMGGTNKSDFVTLAGAVITFIVWQTTSNPTLALMMSIATDYIAFIPSYLKIWVKPETEDWRFYASDIFSSTFSFLSLRSYGLGNIAYPIYIFIINSSSTALILLRGKALRKKSRK